jgi:hypothetical protein
MFKLSMGILYGLWWAFLIEIHLDSGSKARLMLRSQIAGDGPLIKGGIHMYAQPRKLIYLMFPLTE